MQRGNGAVLGKQNTPTTSVATGVWALNEVQRAVLNGTWPSAAVSDPYFENVTMLLHGDGTNGAQNNTFLDSSTNNFTITRNGNTTQGTFAPYGSNWSNYCTSSSGFLSVAASANLASNTGSFTLEFWYNSTATGNGRPLGNNTGNSFGTNNWVFAANDPSLGVGKLGFYVFNYGAYIGSSTSSTVASDGQWHHIVLVRSGNTWAMFIDGVRQGSAVTSSVSFNGTSSAFNIGWSNVSGDVTGFSGYLSNVRFVNGTAVYDPTQTTLTVPTGPLTAITNTALLTAQSNRFIDNSTNAYAITVNGSPSIQRFSPFNPTAPYAAGTDGGSGYFDGTGDYLGLQDSNSAYDLGAGTPFTVECWFYSTQSLSTTTAYNLIQRGGGTDGWSTSSGIQFALYTYGGQIEWDFNTSGSPTTVVSTAGVVANTWYHVAVSYNGTTTALFLNGSRQATTTASYTFPTTRNIARIGTKSAGTTPAWQGYISDMRVVNGTAIYDPTQTTLTVPTAPLTAVTNTKLLTNFTNAGIIDNAEMNNLETVGNAQISTSVKKFGTGSLSFDGTGDWLIGPNSKGLYIGSGNFTIEGWVYLNAIGTQYAVVSQFNANGTGPGWTLYIKSNNVLEFYGGSGTVTVTGTTALTATTWTHFAVVRNGSTITIYVNGTAGGTATNSSFSDDTSALVYVGGRADTSSVALNGYIDDLRITKGYARYTANFTAPTAPFPDF